MDETIVQSEAVNSEQTGDVTEENTSSVREEKDYKKLYHQMAGKYHQLKNQQQPQTDEIDLSDYEEDEINTVRTLARKEAKAIIENERQQELERKELDSFLKANPEAYERLDELKELKEKLPNFSYNKIYSIVTDEEPKRVNIASKTETNINSGGELTPDAIEKSFAKMIGKA